MSRTLVALLLAVAPVTARAQEGPLAPAVTPAAPELPEVQFFARIHSPEGVSAGTFLLVETLDAADGRLDGVPEVGCWRESIEGCAGSAAVPEGVASAMPALSDLYLVTAAGVCRAEPGGLRLFGPNTSCDYGVYLALELRGCTGETAPVVVSGAPPEGLTWVAATDSEPEALFGASGRTAPTFPEFAGQFEAWHAGEAVGAGYPVTEGRALVRRAEAGGEAVVALMAGVFFGALGSCESYAASLTLDGLWLGGVFTPFAEWRPLVGALATPAGIAWAVLDTSASLTLYQRTGVSEMTEVWTESYDWTSEECRAFPSPVAYESPCGP